MSKIKMRVSKRTIKLRDGKKSAEQAFQKKHIKALAKPVEPVQSKQETQEAQATEEIAEVAAAAVQRTAAVPKGILRRGRKKQQGKAPSSDTNKSAVPPVFARTSQKDHLRATTPQPAPRIRSESHVIQAKTTIPRPARFQTESVIQKADRKPTSAIRAPAVSNSPKQPAQVIRQRAATVGRVQRAESQAGRAVRANQTAQAGKTARATQQASQRIAAAFKAAAQQLAAAVGSVLASVSNAAALLAPLLIVVLIGGLLASPLGLFFSAEVEGEVTLPQAVARLNTEFSDRISEIENSVAHDDLRQEGQQAPWKEVLALYAVKVTTDKENPLDAVTMDEEHFAVLQEIFWNMNTIDYTTEPYTEEVTVETEGSSGEVSAEAQTVGKTRLAITITSKAAQEMAAEYQFDEEQLSMMTELLSDAYGDLWYGLPYGGSGKDIVAVALSQVGNVGGEPYWSWFGYSSRAEWCACFVSWCGDQCGYIKAGAMPKFSYCDTGIAWFKTGASGCQREASRSLGT